MRQKAKKGTLKKVLRYIRRYSFFVGLSVLLAAVSAVSSSLVLLLLAAKLVRRRKRKQAEKAGAEEKLP